MRKPWSATPTGIHYFTGQADRFLIVDTCQSILLEVEGEARHVEIGDEFMGGTVEDILAKHHGSSEAYELMVDGESITVRSDRVISYNTRPVTESDVLADDLDACDNYKPDVKEGESGGN